MRSKIFSVLGACIAALSLSVSAYAAETHSISHESGTYGAAQFVRITAEEGAEVFYTTNGSKPDESSKRVGKGAVLVTENTRLRTAAYIDGVLAETASVSIKIRTAVPRASKQGGTYDSAFRVRLTCPDDSARIYYTTDGTAPTNKSQLYSSSITIKEDTVLKFAAYGDNLARSKVVTEKYVISTDVYEDDNRQQLFELINKTRAEYGLAPLEELPALSEIAQRRAKECASYFSHYRPDGTKWDHLLSQAGLKRDVRGENIAYWYPAAEQTLAAWMNDSYHRGNVLNPNAKYIGIGCYGSGRELYWTLLYIGEK